LQPGKKAKNSLKIKQSKTIKKKHGGKEMKEEIFGGCLGVLSGGTGVAIGRRQQMPGKHC